MSPDSFLDEARIDPRQLQDHPALADIQSVDTVHPYGIRLQLTRPSALIEDALSVGIERHEDGRLYGTGPFALSNESENQITFVANRDYHRGTPAVDVVTLTTYPTHRVAWVAMMRREIDFLYQVPTSAREFIEAESSVNLYSVARSYAFTVAFNMARPTFANTEIRRALNHAVDRHAVIERALAGDSRPASGIWAPHWAYGGVERVYRYDPLLADEMLTQAGFPRDEPAGGRPPRSDEIPARLRFNCLVPTFTTAYEDIALVVQRQMHAIGVDMTLESVDPGQLVERVANGDWDAALVPQNTGRTPSRLYSMWHSSEPRAVFGYSTADAALDSLRYAADREELATATTAFQQMLYDDPPGIFIAEDRHARAVSQRFEIPPLLPGQDVMETLWRWRRSEAVP